MRLSTIRNFIAATVAAAAAMAGMAHSADANAAVPEASKTEVKYAAAPLDGFDCDPMAAKAPAAKIKPHHVKKAVAHAPAAPLTVEQKIAREMRRLDNQKAGMAAAIDRAYHPQPPTAVAAPMFKCVRTIAGVPPAFMPQHGSSGSPNHPPAASYPGGHGLNPGGLPSYLTPSSGPGYGGGSGGGFPPPSYGGGGGGGGGGHVPPSIIFPPGIGGGGGGGGTPPGPSVKPPPPRPDYCGLVDAGKLRDDTGSCGPKPPVNPPIINPPPVKPPVVPPVNPPPVKPPVNPPDWCKGLIGGPDTPLILEKCGPGVQPPPPPPPENCLTNKNLPQCQPVHNVPEPSSGALAGVALAAAALLSLRRGQVPTAVVKAAKKFTP